jgi:hypothetical protein
MVVFSRVLEGKNNKERKKELSLSLSLYIYTKGFD